MATGLSERVEELRSDRYHGGSWMARRAPTWTPDVRGRVVYPSYFAELD